MDGTARLQEIAKQLRDGKRPRGTTVRRLLKWFDQERRGTQVIESITANMRKLGIQTKPDFTGTESIDDKISFSAVSAQTASPKELPESTGIVADAGDPAAPQTVSSPVESNEIDIDIGRRIRSLRTANDLTQTQLADKLGVKQPLIATWESGKQRPNNERIAALEGTLGKITTNGSSESYEGSPILGRWLSQSLSRKNWTVVDLARASGVSQPTLYNLLSGRAENARSSTIQKLEKALNDPFPFKSEIKEESTVGGMEFLDFNPLDPSDWPQEAGVYVLYDVASRPAYVGQGTNIARRIKDHQGHKWFIQPFVQTASFIKIDEKALRQNVEKILIKFLKNNAVVNLQHVERE